MTEEAQIVPYEVDIIPFIDEEDVFEQQLSLRPEQIDEPRVWLEKLVSSPI